MFTTSEVVQGGGGDGATYGRQSGPGHYISGLVQIQVEVDNRLKGRLGAASKTGGGAKSNLLYANLVSDNPRDRHILEGELVAQINRKGQRSTTGVLGHPALVSNPVGVELPTGYKKLLGLPASANSRDAAAHEQVAFRHAAREVLKYVIPFGVSRYTVMPGASAGFVAAIAGVLKIINMGEEFLQPGDIITLDLPSPYDLETMRPSDPAAPLTKHNWIARKVAYATPAIALRDEMLDPTSDVGRAIVMLLYHAGVTEERAIELVKNNEKVRDAIRSVHQEQMNTFQMLRRLELGMVVRGARRGEPCLAKAW